MATTEIRDRDPDTGGRVSYAPQLSEPAIRLLLVLLVFGECLYFVLSRVNSIWSGSIDVIGHVSGAAAFMEDGTYPDYGLGPHLSHILGAIAGTVFGSAITGVIVIALCALLLIYLAGAFAIRTLPPALATRTLFILFVLFLLNERNVRLELFGSEIVRNFFYPQLVAQAATLGAIAAWTFSFAAGHDPRWRYLIAFGGVLLAANLHFVPAVVMAAFLALSVAFDAWTDARPGRAVRLAAGGAATFAALAAILLHPAWPTAIANTAHNGALPLRYTDSPIAMAILAVLVAGVCLAALRIWVSRIATSERPSFAFLCALSLFGLAAAGCCLLQDVILFAGYGSPYAVKKYAFSLNTTLFVFLALALAHWGRAWTARNYRRDPFDAPRLSWVLACLTPAVLILSLTHGAHAVLDVPRLIEVDRFARAYSDINFGRPAAGRADFAIGVEGIRDLGNGFVSMTSLRQRLDDNSLAVIQGNELPRPEVVRYILTSAGTIWDVAACRQFTAEIGLVWLDAQCVLKSVGHLGGAG